MSTELQLDKSDWKPVTFGDVVSEVRKSTKDPVADGIEHVVGLEHIEPECIHLRNWASIDEETTFTKTFEKGHVLFGRRRAYLKKAAQADFKGICSGDITVMEAKEELLPELLPFLVCNDKFFDYAVQHSAGGLSPRTKFKDLANYEFLLPPKDQQAKLAELLRSSDEAIKKGIETTEKTEDVLSAEIENEIHGVSLNGRTINAVLAEISGGTELIPLKDCGEIYKGKGIPKSAVVDQGVPCIRYGELYTRHHRVIRHYNSFIEQATIPSALKLEINDVLFAGSGETITEIGKSAAFVSTDEAYAGSDILVFRPDSMDGRFLGYLMNSEIVRQQLNKYGTGATVMHIYKSDLEKIRIPKIPLNTQIKIGMKLENYTQILSQTEARVEHSKALLNSLINQIF